MDRKDGAVAEAARDVGRPACNVLLSDSLLDRMATALLPS